MQSSKVFLVVCAAVVCAVPLSGRGADKKAQFATKPVLVAPTPSAPDALAKAREALQQKMDELNGQPSAVPQAPAPAPQPAPPPAPEPPAPAAPPQTPVAAPLTESNMAPVPAPEQSGPDAAIKAREALRQKMAELNGEPAAAPQVPAAALEPPPAAVPPQRSLAVAPPPKSNMAPVPVLERGDRESILKAREAVRQKMAELPSQTVAAAPSKPLQVEAKPIIKPIKVKEPAKPIAGKPVMEFPALEGPPSPLAAEKQQRLQALLQKYKVDQLTPEQYHLERAKVLAAP